MEESTMEDRMNEFNENLFKLVRRGYFASDEYEQKVRGNSNGSEQPANNSKSVSYDNHMADV